LTSDASEPANTLLAFAKSQLVPALEAKFNEFPSILMNIHGKDITVSAPTSQEPSRSATPVAPASSATTFATSQTKPTTAPKGLNTTSLTVEANFMASADDLFSILTDEKRIPQWSHNSAVVSPSFLALFGSPPVKSNPTAGSSYSLFGGGVKGTYTSVSPPTRFIQTWALQNPTWPSGSSRLQRLPFDDLFILGHSATLTTSLNQSSDSTNITWNMTGVPIGMEDEIQRNIQGY
jgi:activator of HSP90 ATPase